MGFYRMSSIVLSVVSAPVKTRVYLIGPMTYRSGVFYLIMMSNLGYPFQTWLVDLPHHTSLVVPQHPMYRWDTLIARTKARMRSIKSGPIGLYSLI